MIAIHTRHGWYKAFSTINGLFYLVFLFLVSRCRFDFLDLNELFQNFMCVVYSVSALATFVFGIAVTLVGIDHAEREGKHRYIFYLMLLVYFVGMAFFVWLNFLQ